MREIVQVLQSCRMPTLFCMSSTGRPSLLLELLLELLPVGPVSVMFLHSPERCSNMHQLLLGSSQHALCC